MSDVGCRMYDVGCRIILDVGCMMYDVGCMMYSCLDPITCDCGTWGSLLVQNAAGTVKYECGKEIEAKCNQSFDFRSTYQCKSSDKSCEAKTKWTVSKDGVLIKAGNGLIGSFTPTSNGVYTITLNAECKGKACPPCTYTIIVKDCEPSGTGKKGTGPKINYPLNRNDIGVIFDNRIVSPPPGEEKPKSKTQVIKPQSFYYSIRPEYSGAVIDVKDTLFFQIENNYSSGSNQLTYTIRNLSNNKTSRLTKLDIKNSQGLIRIALPIQNSVVGKGETGMLTLSDSKKYYYINFKRD